MTDEPTIDALTAERLAQAMLRTSDEAGQPSLSIEWYRFWAELILARLREPHDA